MILKILMMIVALCLNIFIAMHIKKDFYKNKLMIVGIFLVTLCTLWQMIVVGFLINIFICLLAFDAIKFIINNVCKKTIGQKGYIIVIIFSLILSFYGIYNAKNVVMTTYQVTLDKEFDDKKIMMISDVHLGTTIKNLDLVLTQANEIKPDIICLVGDVYDENTSVKEVEDSLKVFAELSKKYPLYYVVGNHEVGFGSSPLEDYDLLNRLKQVGVVVLNDEYVECNELNIVGRQDYMVSSRKEMREIIVGIDQSKPMILLDHQPRELKELKELGVDLMLSGHTHAGQFFPMLPLWNLLGINEMNYGYVNDGDFNVIVSSGLGTWGMMMRTSQHCEIVVIELKGK